MSSLRAGVIVELDIAKILLEENFGVYKPLVDDEGVDFIIRNKKHNYYELQVKSARNYNQITNIKKPDTLPNNYLILIHYIHDVKENEFIYLTKPQFSKIYQEKYGDLKINKKERNLFQHQDLNALICYLKQ